jgi:hypothetical protein
MDQSIRTPWRAELIDASSEVLDGAGEVGCAAWLAQSACVR